MFKNFLIKFFHSIFELIIKLIGFKSVCWIVATIAFFMDKLTEVSWLVFTSVVIGTKFAKDLKKGYPILNFLKGIKG